MSDVNQGPPSTKSFTYEVAKYFMDFLETNFHRRRAPKRSIQIKNRKNLLVGINLKKYFDFYLSLLSGIKSGLPSDNVISIPRRKFSVRISSTLITLVGEYCKAIDPYQHNLFLGDCKALLSEVATQQHDDIERAVSFGVAGVQEIFKQIYVEPLFAKIANSLKAQYDYDDTHISSMKDELAVVATAFFEEQCKEIVSKLSIDPADETPLESLDDLISVKRVQNSLTEYFAQLQAKDLFVELSELENNRRIMDKQELYLYLADISFDNSTYPLFYVPVQFKKEKDTISLSLDPNIYVNKKVVEYINDQLNKKYSRTGKIAEINDRILHREEGDELLKSRMQPILTAITHKFQTQPAMDLSLNTRQSSTNVDVKISNNAYFAIFDKSDEALINDYEELLGVLDDPNSQVAQDFEELIKSFIFEEPSKVNSKVQDEWDRSSVSERLVYRSPVPVNAEQRQILKALKQDKCRYISVEGPPGTGKSHTITALVFDAILNKQSVLVLSDKKEALDVVEDKITSTLNKVRMDHDFQNPILRLGKLGNTYSKILNTASLNRIKNHYRAMRNSLPQLQQETDRVLDLFQTETEELTEKLTDIQVKDIKHFHDLEAQVGKEAEALLDLSELLTTDDKNFSNSFTRLKEITEELSLLFSAPQQALVSSLAESLAVKKLEDFIDLAHQVQSLYALEANESELKALSSFRSISRADLKGLMKIQESYQNRRWPGYLSLLNWRLNRETFELLKSGNYLNPQTTSLKVASQLDAYLKLRLEISSRIEDSRIDQHLCEWLQDRGLNREERQGLFDLISDLEFVLKFHSDFPKSAKKLGLDPDDIFSLSTSPLIDLQESHIPLLGEYIEAYQKLSDQFDSIPQYSHLDRTRELESLFTAAMTYMLDERLVSFHENHSATAKTLAQIIRKKRKFPKGEFHKLKEAFPCIIAGIRDYAEYIPFEIESFDLVIIDEASQVSIAQALPAIVRGKKVVVLGDKRQFSNIKSAQARSETNQEYLTHLSTVFRKEVVADASALERMRRFDIKTSVLDFFEYISHFNVMLKKHFRGYRELISYSSKYFYNDQLQAIKIRSLPVSEIILFTYVEPDGKKELIENTNSPEIDAIVAHLESLCANPENKPSLGIITPHTNQQKLLLDRIQSLDIAEELFGPRRLKVMTFDTCQGEERDIIIYSMVATPAEDKLRWIFAADISTVDLDDEGKIKAQRLNVGFSRSKEQIHIFHSKPIEEFTGEIGRALRHYKKVLSDTQDLPDASQVDPNSPMEKKALHWIMETDFFRKNQEAIKLSAQFPIGEYLKQLDPFYTHPKYVVDFLLIYTQGSKTHKIIIEYDGFREHFTQTSQVNSLNYENYYKEADIVREKTLESYGYKFLRINRFNTGKDPVQTLDLRLKDLVQSDGTEGAANVIQLVSQVRQRIESGQVKQCKSCDQYYPLSDFEDPSLASGMGRKCRKCKSESSAKPRSRRHLRPLESQSPGQTQKLAADCPRCGAGMVKRKGRYGQFLGCETYPRCRGTRPAA